MSGLVHHRPSMLLATPLRTRPDDLGSVILLPYQMRAVQVGTAPAARRRQWRLGRRRRHAGERLQELRLAALPAVVERDARQVVVLQHVQRHALHIKIQGSSESQHWIMSCHSEVV